MTSKDTQDSIIQTTMTTPTTSTAVDNSLPPPVVQSIASSSHSRRLRKKTVRVAGLSVHWARFKKRMSTVAAPSSSSVIGESAAENSYTRKMETTTTGVADYLDEVVVDRNWTEEIKSSVSHSDHNGSPEKSGGSHQPNQGTSDHDSVVYDGFWTFSTILAILRWRTWPFIMEIFSSRFVDEKSEQHYAQVRIFLFFAFQVGVLQDFDFKIFTSGKLVYQEISRPLGIPLAHRKLGFGVYIHPSQPHSTTRQNLLFWCKLR